jgi:hypothetical protein
MREAWAIIATAWNRTVDRARLLGEPSLHERVNDEWSFAETLRHLLFVTDAWIGRAVLGQAHPFHQLGLPPDHRIGRAEARVDVAPWGIDVFAVASVGEVLAARATRTSLVDGVIEQLTPARLRERCPTNQAAGFPTSTALPIGVCVDVVLGEEWAHHHFATRDLAALEGRRTKEPGLQDIWD